MKFISGQTIPWNNQKGYSKKKYVDEDDLNSPGSLVQEIKIPPRERTELHYHKIQTEIFYFFDDAGYWIVNGEIIHPKKGDVLVLEPNDMHEVINDTDKEYIYICFKINYVQDDFYLD